MDVLTSHFVVFMLLGWDIPMSVIGFTITTCTLLPLLLTVFIPSSCVLARHRRDQQHKNQLDPQKMAWKKGQVQLAFFLAVLGRDGMAQLLRFQRRVRNRIARKN